MPVVELDTSDQESDQPAEQAPEVRPLARARHWRTALADAAIMQDQDDDSQLDPGPWEALVALHDEVELVRHLGCCRPSGACATARGGTLASDGRGGRCQDERHRPGVHAATAHRLPAEGGLHAGDTRVLGAVPAPARPCSGEPPAGHVHSWSQASRPFSQLTPEHVAQTQLTKDDLELLAFLKEVSCAHGTHGVMHSSQPGQNALAVRRDIAPVREASDLRRARQQACELCLAPAAAPRAARSTQPAAAPHAAAWCSWTCGLLRAGRTTASPTRSAWCWRPTTFAPARRPARPSSGTWSPCAGARPCSGMQWRPDFVSARSGPAPCPPPLHHPLHRLFCPRQPCSAAVAAGLRCARSSWQSGGSLQAVWWPCMPGAPAAQAEDWGAFAERRRAGQPRFFDWCAPRPHLCTARRDSPA